MTRAGAWTLGRPDRVGHDYGHLHALIDLDRQSAAELLAHLAEVDDRKLYLEAAFPSMYAWCAQKLHLTQDAALRRIQAARMARKFPAIFPALADGRLNLTAVCLLAPHLTDANACGLLTVAAFKTKAEILLLLAERFPRTEMLPLVEALPTPCREPGDALASAPVAGDFPMSGEHALAHVKNPSVFANVAPTAARRFALHFSIGQDMHTDLVYAQELLSHQIPPRRSRGSVRAR